MEKLCCHDPRDQNGFIVKKDLCAYQGVAARSLDNHSRLPTSFRHVVSASFPLCNEQQ
jgi:hypothetical protein